MSEDAAVSTMESAKRKSSIQEIEVDLSAPEPPSKRARRALKKGKPVSKKTVGEDDNDVDDGSGGKDDQRESKDRRRSQHGIWIGNLPFAVTAISLRKWLVENSGEVITDDCITRVKLPMIKDPGGNKSGPATNKGFAYVDFAELGPKVAAMALSETSFGGRKVLIKDSKSFEGRPDNCEAGEGGAGGKQAEVRKDASASRKLFVGNMGFTTTEDDVRKNFEKCGEIEWVKMATFEDTGKCKGYGWVKFKEAEAAAWAIKGFVRIKEEVELEADFRSDGDEDAGHAGDEVNRFKTRKWWVNRLQGRQLKLELAEDEQTRYRKRFGKDAATRDNGSKPVRQGKQSTTEAGGKTGERQARGSWNKAGRPLAEDVDLQTARMMGKVVKHTGTKVTFD